MSQYTMSSETWPGLGKLLEEMGELQVNLGKLIVNHGSVDYAWEQRSLLPEIHDEIADVLASINFFIEENNLARHYINGRAQEKLEKYNRWKVANE